MTVRMYYILDKGVTINKCMYCKRLKDCNVCKNRANKARTCDTTKVKRCYVHKIKGKEATL